MGPAQRYRTARPVGVLTETYTITSALARTPSSKNALSPAPETRDVMDPMII